MPTKKTIKDKESVGSVQNVRIVAVPRVIMALAAIFLITWTLIGISLVLLIALSVQKGTFKGLANVQQQSQTRSAQEVPTETELPGVGRVNIACVQNALSPESIQKLVSTGDASFLEGEEKTKFDACIVK